MTEQLDALQHCLQTPPTNRDGQLAFCLDLLDLAETRPGQFRILGREILAEDASWPQVTAAADWTQTLLAQPGRKMEHLFQTASLLAHLTGDPAIAKGVLNKGLEAALESMDLPRLRQIRAICVALLLRPMILETVGGRTQKRWLTTCADRALQALHTAIQEHVPPRPAAAETPPADTHRVVLSVAWVPANADFGAHLRQLCSYAHSLILAGRDKGISVRVKVLFTYDASASGLAQPFQGFSQKIPISLRESFDNALGADAQYVEIDHIRPDTQGGIKGWARAVEEALVSFGATAILRWYGFYSADVIGPILHRTAPTIGLQFNASNRVDRYADLLLNQGALSEVQSRSDDRWRPHRIPLEVIPKRLNTTREAFGLKPGRRNLVSVLSGGRLETALRELSDDHRADLCAFFDRAPDLDWILVGVQDPQALQGYDDRIDALLEAGRIIVQDFVDDLRALYPYCVAMLHLPKMRGGGMGVAMAIEEHLPVCAYAGTDPENFLHPDTVCHSWESLMTCLTDALSGTGTATDIAQAQRHWMQDKHGLRGVGTELLAFIDEATARRATG